MSDFENHIRNDLVFWDDAVCIDLWYPRQAKQKAIHVGLTDVRAADQIRIEYDFDRDGWVIKQASNFCGEVGKEIDFDWQEVAFVKAWAREIGEGAL